VKDFCEVSEINEATFYSWMKKYRSKPEDDVKACLSERQDFTTIQVLPSVKVTKPGLFAEVGSIRLYKEVSGKYLKALLP